MDMSLKGNLQELGTRVDPDEEFSLVNMTVDIDGDNAQISMTGLFASFMGIDEDQALEMLVVDEQTYIRGPLPLLGASESAWYIMDKDDGAVPFEPESMFGSFTDENIDVTGFTSTGSEQLDGQQCTVFIPQPTRMHSRRWLRPMMRAACCQLIWKILSGPSSRSGYARMDMCINS